MANIKGGRAARKRDRQNEKARKRNSVCKAKLHDAHKKLFKAADANDKESAEKKFKEFVSGLDKAVKKGIITKNCLIIREQLLILLFLTTIQMDNSLQVFQLPF